MKTVNNFERVINEILWMEDLGHGCPCQRMYYRVEILKRMLPELRELESKAWKYDELSK